LRITKVYGQGQLDSQPEAGTMGLAQQRPGRSRKDGSSMEVRRAEPSGEHNESSDRDRHGDRDKDKNKNNDETRRLRRLQIMMSMVMSVISQDPDLTLEEAAEMAANARRAALSMFPDKELAYDILYRPRLQRLMNERFRLQ
jgi:hypothetical protein